MPRPSDDKPNPRPTAALIVVDMQEDFCEPHGSLAIPGGRALAPLLNQLLDMPGFALRIATRDVHPRDHVSFASRHAGAVAYRSTHVIPNPENADEVQTTEGWFGMSKKLTGSPSSFVGPHRLLWPDHCVQATPGVELIPELHAAKLTHVVDKGGDARVESYSGFGPPFRHPAVAMSGLHGLLADAGVVEVFVVGLALDFCVKSTAIDAVEFGYRTYLIEGACKAAVQSDDALAATRKELTEKGVIVLPGVEAAEVQRLRSEAGGAEE